MSVLASIFHLHTISYIEIVSGANSRSTWVSSTVSISIYLVTYSSTAGTFGTCGTGAAAGTFAGAGAAAGAGGMY